MNLSSLEKDREFYFHKNTSREVRNILTQAFLLRKTVRLWMGDTTTGRAWPEENDVLGKIGRSCGSVKIPLLMGSGEGAGPGLLDHCIVRIDLVARRKLRSNESRVDDSTARSVIEGVTAYQHPSFHTGTWEVAPSDIEGYRETALLNGQVHARFKHAKQASAYCEFMAGNSYALSA